MVQSIHESWVQTANPGFQFKWIIRWALLCYPHCKRVRGVLKDQVCEVCNVSPCAPLYRGNVGPHLEMGAGGIRTTMFALPPCQKWCPSDRPNPFIKGPQISAALQKKKKCTVDHAAQSIRMGVNCKPHGSCVTQGGPCLWSIHMDQQWAPCQVCTMRPCARCAQDLFHINHVVPLTDCIRKNLGSIWFAGMVLGMNEMESGMSLEWNNTEW